MSEQTYPLASLSAHACTNSLRGCSSVGHGCVGVLCADSAVPFRVLLTFFHTVPFRSVPRFINDPRDQSNCRLWFRLRAGRITASRFKSACSTDPASPSLSLIMGIYATLSYLDLALQQRYMVASMRRMLLTNTRRWPLIQISRSLLQASLLVVSTPF